MLTVETCALCKGQKSVFEFQERFGEEWRPEKGTADLPPYAQDEMRAAALSDRPDAFRWQEIECPCCNGRGEYVVEHFPFKIF